MNDSTRTPTGNRPLVLLDVDGVINDLQFLRGHSRPWDTEVFRSHEHIIGMPAYMPELIGRLANNAEIMWCTTWRELANDDIAHRLGVGRLPVVTDGTRIRHVDWKPAAAAPVAAAALGAGRRVFWIEDFAGHVPRDSMPDGVEYIDTAADGEYVLMPAHLPLVLTAEPTPSRSSR